MKNQENGYLLSENVAIFFRFPLRAHSVHQNHTFALTL